MPKMFAQAPARSPGAPSGSPTRHVGVGSAGDFPGHMMPSHQTQDSSAASSTKSQPVA